MDPSIINGITYRQQLVNCCKPKCSRCKRGPSHGPYWYAEWKDKEGRVRTKYVGKRLPVEVRDVYVAMPEGPWPDNMNAGKVRAIALVELAQSYATADRREPRSYATRDRGRARGSQKRALKRRRK